MGWITPGKGTSDRAHKDSGAASSAGRAVACDFDNTLYFTGAEEPMRASDIFSILYFQQRGGLFGICTGRSLVGVRDVIGPYIRPDFYILASGALVIGGESEVLCKKCMPLETVEKIYRRFEGRLRMVIQADDTVYTFGEETYLQTRIDSFSALDGADIYGVSCAAGDEKTAAEAAEEINRLYGDEVTAFQNTTHVDVISRGTSKGEGARVVKEALGVRELYGIGDSYNDLPLLESADHACAMEHAPIEIREKAEYVVRSVSELLDRI